jgi:hypothetical protein
MIKHKQHQRLKMDLQQGESIRVASPRLSMIIASNGRIVKGGLRQAQMNQSTVHLSTLKAGSIHNIILIQDVRLYDATEKQIK